MGLDPLQWIEARFQGSAALRAAFPGDLHAGRADPSTPRPYLTVNILDESPGFSSEAAYSEGVRIQFSVFADALGQARTLRTLLARDPAAGFDFVDHDPLGGGDEVVESIRVGGTLTLDPDPGPEAGELWMATVDYLFLVYRES